MDYVELNHRKRFPGTWCVVLAFIACLLVLEWAFLDGRMIAVRIMAMVIPVMAISSLLDVRTAYRFVQGWYSQEPVAFM